jgi:hypothetical protein
VAFADFYITGSGSNLNAGSTSGAATYTSSAGNWDGSANFTPTDGSTPSSTISPGMWASVYTGSPGAATYIAQITSVGSGIDGAITLSSTAKFGTAPTSNTGGASIRVGGAWASLGIIAIGAALNSGTVTQSTRINIQAGTYANTTSGLNFSLAGSTTAPLWWRGYQNTPGDQDGNPTAIAGTNIPAITFTTGQMTISGTHQIFSSLDVSGACTSTNGQVNVIGAISCFYRFRSTNTAGSATSYAIRLSSTATCVSCYFKASTTANYCVATTASGNASWLFGCYIGGGITGYLQNNSAYLVHSVFDSQAGDGIVNAGSPLGVINCTFYNQSGNGINISTTPTDMALIANCYFDTITTSGKYAINNSTGTSTDLVRCVGNAFYNCAGNVTGLGDFPLIFDNGTLSNSALFSPASQVFTINSLGYNLGFPGGLEKLASSVGYLDIGALQHLGGGLGQIMRVAGQHFPVW